jgi:hypothetical protein
MTRLNEIYRRLFGTVLLRRQIFNRPFGFIVGLVQGGGGGFAFSLEQGGGTTSGSETPPGLIAGCSCLTTNFRTHSRLSCTGDHPGRRLSAAGLSQPLLVRTTRPHKGQHC